MADFAVWGCAAARALGYSDQEFLEAYGVNVAAQNEGALEASPVAQCVLRFTEEREDWEGTSSELLQALASVAEELGFDTRQRIWPKDPTRLSKRLREVQTNLAAVGLQVEFSKSGRRLITLHKATRTSAHSVLSVQPKLSVPIGLDAVDAKDATSPDSKDQWEVEVT